MAKGDLIEGFDAFAEMPRGNTADMHSVSFHLSTRNNCIREVRSELQGFTFSKFFDVVGIISSTIISNKTATFLLTNTPLFH